MSAIFTGRGCITRRMPDWLALLVLTRERVTRVLIDLRMVRGRLHGIARYALELARRLPSLQPSWEFAGLTAPGGIPDGLGDLKPQIPLVACAAGFLSPLEQPALLASLSRASCDLFHATSFSVPALWPGKLVVTLHDATHVALPEFFSWTRSVYYRIIVKPRASIADGVITVSNFSKEELSRHLSISPDRFRVIPLGVAEPFRPMPRDAVEALIREYELPEKYFLAVANTKKHKNLAVLLQIASRLPAPLVLVTGGGGS